jgi:hypothetical protein
MLDDLLDVIYLEEKRSGDEVLIHLRERESSSLTTSWS